MTQAELKRRAGEAALRFVAEGSVIGVGTGSTTNCFIDALIESGPEIAGAVASSAQTAKRLRNGGIALVELASIEQLPLYVDGADEATRKRELIKGGGGALTREKIIAGASRRFVCIVDETKLVERLGAFALPVEVIPMARRHVARAIERLGGRPLPRPGLITENGNLILDVHGLDLARPDDVEEQLNQIPGVVANGLFCRRPADIVLVGAASGVLVID